MTDPNTEDDPVFFDHHQLVESGLSSNEAWDLIRLRESRAEAARERLLVAHPTFRLPDDGII